MSEMQLGGRTYKLHKVQKAQNQSNTAETETGNARHYANDLKIYYLSKGESRTQ